MTSYLVPAGFGEAEYIDKKSRFIARVWRVESESEALERIGEMRKKHADATHNVYAYVVREGKIMRFSDDGEPGGTSGMPTLNVFRSQNIEDVCCVVTRYFGGILLGSGGLVRAYSKAASMALEAAGVAEMQSWKQMEVTCSYPLYERMKRLLDTLECVEESSDFGAEIILTVLCRADKTAQLKDAVRELSKGSAGVRENDEKFCPVRIK